MWDARSGELVARDPPLPVRADRDSWWDAEDDEGEPTEWIRFDPGGAWLVWRRGDGALGVLGTELESEDPRALRARAEERLHRSPDTP